MGKKKGAANKLARMSEEERARYLQHRAEIEEEARRRKQQLIAIFMKNKLKREEAFARLNLAKINQEWRTILRNIKCQQLKDEIKTVEEYFADALDRKKQVIHRLLGDLDENEEQYATMSHAHIRNVDTLINLHKERVIFWRSAYLKEKAALMSDFHQEMTRYKQMKLDAFRELECVFYGLEARADTEAAEAAELQSRKLDNIKSEMILKLQSITEEREKSMDEQWRNFQTLLSNYLQNTEEQHNEYMDLRKRDDEDTKIINFHYAEVQRLTETIANLKHTMETQRESQRVQMDEMQNYKRLLQAKLGERKAAIEDRQKVDKENMRWMVVCSNKALTYLSDVKRTLDNIVHIGAMCEKYEKESEAIRSLTSKESRQSSEMSEADLKKPPADFKEATMSVLTEMEPFWVRYNSAEIDCASLVEEKAALKRENRQLKEQLKMYLTNVTLADGSGGNAQDKLRPSSMRIERYGQSAAGHLNSHGLMMADKQRMRRRPVTSIEANLTPAVRSRSLVANRVRMPDVFAFVNY